MVIKNVFDFVTLLYKSDFVLNVKSVFYKMLHYLSRDSYFRFFILLILFIFLFAIQIFWIYKRDLSNLQETLSREVLFQDNIINKISIFFELFCKEYESCKNKVEDANNIYDLDFKKLKQLFVEYEKSMIISGITDKNVIFYQDNYINTVYRKYFLDYNFKVSLLQKDNIEILYDKNNNHIIVLYGASKRCIGYIIPMRDFVRYFPSAQVLNVDGEMVLVYSNNLQTSCYWIKEYIIRSQIGILRNIVMFSFLTTQELIVICLNGLLVIIGFLVITMIWNNKSKSKILFLEKELLISSSKIKRFEIIMDILSVDLHDFQQFSLESTTAISNDTIVIINSSEIVNKIKTLNLFAFHKLNIEFIDKSGDFDFTISIPKKIFEKIIFSLVEQILPSICRNQFLKITFEIMHESIVISFEDNGIDIEFGSMIDKVKDQAEKLCFYNWDDLLSVIKNNRGNIKIDMISNLRKTTLIFPLQKEEKFYEKSERVSEKIIYF